MSTLSLLSWSQLTRTVFLGYLKVTHFSQTVLITEKFHLLQWNLGNKKSHKGTDDCLYILGGLTEEASLINDAFIKELMRNI